MFEVLLHPLANRELEELDSEVRRKVEAKLKKLREFPRRGKPLRHSPFRSLRIGDHRAIYEVDPEKSQVRVLYIGHRRNVYTEFSKIF